MITAGRRPFPLPGLIRRSGIAGAGMAILLTVTLVALFAPWLAGHDPHAFSGDPLLPPSSGHLLGTTDSGQDIFAQLVYGARETMLVAPVTALLTLLVGTAVGVAAALSGPRFGAVITRLIDVWLTVPKLPLLLLMAATAGSSLPVIVLTMTALFWPVTARVVRAQTLSLRRREFISAARGFGAGGLYISRRHLAPGLAPVLLSGLIPIASIAVVLEAGLAFLGLGDPHRPSWGLILNQALAYPALLVGHTWLWWVVPPALALTFTVLGFTFTGVGLEPRFNPQVTDHIG